MIRYMCLLCNRCAFTKKSSHYCVGAQFRKRGLVWQKVIYHLKESK